jgi:hypothetical protein
MRPRRRIASVLGAVIGVAITAAAQVVPPAAFGVGVLRRDGVVVPFADFDGKHWRANWPAAKDHVDVPVSVGSVPGGWWGKAGPHDTWQAWIRSENPVTARVTQPDWVAVQCLRQVGLRTDYRSAEVPPDPQTQPYPKDGIAVWPPQRIERIDIISPGQLVPQPVVDAFNEAEETARRYERGQAPRLTSNRKARESIPNNVEAIYVTGDPAGTRVYYFEVSKHYGRRGDDCPLVTFGAGWFVRDGAGELRKLRFDVEVVDCERYGLLYMLPLGVVRLSNRLYWIAQWSGWDYEEYGIVEIKPKTAEDVIQVVGGRC